MQRRLLFAVRHDIGYTYTPLHRKADNARYTSEGACMYKLFASTILVCNLFFAQGCVNALSGNSSAAQEPEARVSDVYYSEFTTIPIPKDMKEVPKYTAVMQTADGMKNGTQIFEGPVERQSLVAAMYHNMTLQGWQLRAGYRAQRSLLVFQDATRIAVLSIRESMGLSRNVKMEIWVAQRLPDGVTPPTPYATSPSVYGGVSGGMSGSTPPTSAPEYSTSPTYPSSGYGVQEQGLAQ